MFCEGFSVGDCVCLVLVGVCVGCLCLVLFV